MLAGPAVKMMITIFRAKKDKSEGVLNEFWWCLGEVFKVRKKVKINVEV